MSDTQWPRYEVFQQEAPDRPHRHAGSVHAPDAEIALLNGRDVFVRRPACSRLWVWAGQGASAAKAQALQEAARACGPQTPFVLWVVPAAQLTRSEPDQAEPLFAPA